MGIVPVDDVEQTVFGPHVFPPFFQLIVVAGTVIMVPRVAHIHVFVDKGGDGYGSGCKPLVVVIPQPLEELVHVEQAGVGIAGMAVIARFLSSAWQALVVLIAGILYIFVIAPPIVFINGKLDPAVVADATSRGRFARAGRCARRVGIRKVPLIYRLVIRGLHAPGQARHLCAVQGDQYTVVVGVQFVRLNFAHDHVALVAGAGFFFLGHLHLDVVHAADRDGVDVVRIAAGVVIVRVLIGITQMDCKLHVGIDRIATLFFIRQRARHFHVSGVCRCVGESAVFVFLSRLITKIITRFRLRLIPLFAQGVPCRCVRHSGFSGNLPCGGLAAFRHVKHESATIQ